ISLLQPFWPMKYQATNASKAMMIIHFNTLPDADFGSGTKVACGTVFSIGGTTSSVGGSTFFSDGLGDSLVGAVVSGGVAAPIVGAPFGSVQEEIPKLF